MAAMSDWLEGKFLDHSLRIASWTMPTGLWVALFTTATTDASLGTEVPLSGSYARQVATFGAGAAANERSNSVSCVFPNMPAVTVSHAAIVDTATHSAGNMLYHGALTAPVVMTAGNAFVFNIGDIDVQLT